MATPIIWTTKRIKQEIRKVHGRRYDLSKVEGTGYKHVITLGCKEHGDFQIKVSRVINGSGCQLDKGNHKWSEARRQASSQNLKGINTGPSPHRMTVKEIKQRIRELHGNKFNLSLITNDLPTKYLTLICKKHGKFEKVRADALHYKNMDCPRCIGKIFTSEDFIARIKNQPKWISYKKTIYTGPKNLVTITCKYHGDVECRPGVLIYGTCDGSYCCKACNDKRIRDKRVASGQYPDPKLKQSYESYRQVVRRLSNQAYRKFIKHELEPDRDRRWHLDHEYSIKEGFKNNVPAEIIGHVSNLEIISSLDNRYKQDKCSKTLKQLYRDYKEYEKQ